MMASPPSKVISDVVVNLLGDFSLSIYLLPLQSLVWRIDTTRKYYGLATSFVLNLLVRNLWCAEAEILSSNEDQLAISFREAHQSECNMTAVTVRIPGNAIRHVDSVKYY